MGHGCPENAIRLKRWEVRSVADPAPLVLSLGCPEGTSAALAAAGLMEQPVRSIQALEDPEERPEARAILLHQDAFEASPLADAIPRIRRMWPLVDVVVWAPGGSGRMVRDALQAGARDVVLATAPAAAAALTKGVIERQRLLPHATRRHGAGSARTRFEGLVARSEKMWDIFDIVARVAGTEATTLILGETGTGKELVARAIHQRSGRTGRFVAVNCGAVPENLIDSELFGHVKGAFTGATHDKKGLFRYAEGGTIFLDEIGTLPLSAQFSLLRALQESEIRPVGGHEEIAVDVRVLSATSDDLEEAVRKGTFREDLFYRLDVIRITVPPLRERPEDITFLFNYFATRLARSYETVRPEPTADFLDALLSYDWPGNVRQLENVTERLVLTQQGRMATAATFERLVGADRTSTAPEATAGLKEGTIAAAVEVELSGTLREAVSAVEQEVERAYLTRILAETAGRMGVAADRAGVSRRTLLRKLQRHGIDRRDYRGRES
jgi:DNA-binding NtrC family response regulator